MTKNYFLFTILILILFSSCEHKSKSISEIEKKIAVEWTEKNVKILDLFNIRDGSAELITTIICTDTIMYRGHESWFVLTKTIPVDKQYDNALLSSLLGVHVYAIKTGDSLYFKYFTQAGNFGGDPVYSIINMENNNIGVVLEKGNTQMGITTGHIDLYSFKEKDFIQILNIRNAFFDNSGYATDSCDIKEIKTSIKVSEAQPNKLLITTQSKQFNKVVQKYITTDSTYVFNTNLK